MASFTTGIEELTKNGGSSTFVVSSTHSNSEPRLVLTKRKFADGGRTSYESYLGVVNGLIDADDKPIQEKLALSTTARVPVVATGTEVDEALATFRDFVASDEFTALVKTQLDLA
jgi:hypothetical protein